MNEKTVKENLANMTFKEKCSYLLYYYKIHMIVFIIAIICIGSFVYTESSKKDIYFNISYIGTSLSDENLQVLKDNLTEAIIPDNKSEDIEVTSYDLSTPVSQTKFQASLATKEIDMAIVNPQFFDTNYPNDFFLDLNSIAGFSSLNLSDDCLIKKDNGVYGIKLNNLNTKNPTNSNGILVVMSNSERSDKLIEFIKSLGIN